MRPSASSKMRSARTFSASRSAASASSSRAMPSSTSSPGPIALVTRPSTVTAARLTRCTSARTGETYPLATRRRALPSGSNAFPSGAQRVASSRAPPGPARPARPQAPTGRPEEVSVSYLTLLYDSADAVATITLNRPTRLNTIVPPMPDELEAAVRRALAEEEVNVIVLRGAGRAFCAGFDFGGGFHHWDAHITTDGAWDAGKDFMPATSQALGAVPKFMSLWRSPKPVIAQVHGWCVGGGSDLALCADVVVASEDARIGTPYSRMWGCYLTGMWLYRLGLTKAKEFALTGKPLSGLEEIGRAHV